MSTYSTRLKIELIGSGEQSNSWGNTTNNNFDQVFEQSIAGVYSKNLGAETSPYTLTSGNGPQTQANNEARQAAMNTPEQRALMKRTIDQTFKETRQDIPHHNKPKRVRPPTGVPSRAIPGRSTSSNQSGNCWRSCET